MILVREMNIDGIANNWKSRGCVLIRCTHE